MPNTQTAKKELRKSEARRLRNRTQRSTLRTYLKKFRALATSGEGPSEDIEKSFRLAVKKLDQAASKHLIHKNTASRLKSRMAALKKKATAPAA